MLQKQLVGILWKILTIETKLPVLLLRIKPQSLEGAEAIHCHLRLLRGAGLVS